MKCKSVRLVAAALMLILISVVGVACDSVEFVTISLPEALGNGLPTLAEFGADWCDPCKTMKPILMELAADYEGRLNVVIVNLDKEGALGSAYQIRTMPTQIIFDAEGAQMQILNSRGTAADRNLGIWLKAAIVQELTRLGLV